MNPLIVDPFTPINTIRAVKFRRSTTRIFLEVVQLLDGDYVPLAVNTTLTGDLVRSHLNSGFNVELRRNVITGQFIPDTQRISDHIDPGDLFVGGPWAA
jgi:hypothetical protein